MCDVCDMCACGAYVYASVHARRSARRAFANRNGLCVAAYVQFAGRREGNVAAAET